MTLRQFEVFLAVARARSFRRAAEALHLSQPALSQHVAELETELSARLLDRLGRSVTLTEAGQLLEEHAQRLFATLTSAREAIGELQGLRRGSLLIGASTTPGIYVLPGVIGAFRQRYPGVDLRLRIANSRVIEERLRANELDLGVVGGHHLGPGEECLAAGLLDELMLLVPPSHPWARRREIPPERLAEQPLLVREEGSATRRVTERALERAGITFRIAMELDHIEAIKQAVMAGLGVAFLSIHAVRGEVATGRLQPLRLRGIRIQRHFHVIHSEARTLSPSARAFTALLEETRGRRRGAPRAPSG
ncbi:MAG: LysR family transcriptional regulator [Candidatus Rokubacteria bacterium]|nr:LysR family transcriptional regulator [Candidatus Rokubacteria bacterium]